MPRALECGGPPQDGFAVADLTPLLRREVRRARPLLGTLVDVACDGSPNDITAAFATIEKVHRLMSFHDPSSDVTRINREAFRRTVMRSSLDLARLASGAGFFARKRRIVRHHRPSFAKATAGRCTNREWELARRFARRKLRGAISPPRDGRSWRDCQRLRRRSGRGDIAEKPGRNRERKCRRRHSRFWIDREDNPFAQSHVADAGLRRLARAESRDRYFGDLFRARRIDRWPDTPHHDRSIECDRRGLQLHDGGRAHQNRFCPAR